MNWKKVLTFGFAMSIAVNPATHIDLMENSEQLFDDPSLATFGQQGQRVRSRTDSNSLLDSPRS